MEGIAQKEQKRRISNKNMRKINGIICMLPWLIGFLLFFVKPLASTIKYSFSEVGVADTGGMELKFVGIRNYINLFSAEVSSQSSQFLRVFIDENVSIFINTPVIVVFSLFCAILINIKFKGQGIARVIFFCPLYWG